MNISSNKLFLQIKTSADENKMLNSKNEMIIINQ